MAAISRKMTAASLLTDAIEILRQSLFIKRNAGQGSRFKAAFVRHFFNFDIWEQTALKKGSLSNGVDDLENFTSEMEWSFFVPVVCSCVFSNWYSYVSTPPAFPLAWIHV